MGTDDPHVQLPDRGLTSSLNFPSCLSALAFLPIGIGTANYLINGRVVSRPKIVWSKEFAVSK
jgi:hypothetical protein